MQNNKKSIKTGSKLKLTRWIISILFFVLTCLSIGSILPQQVANQILSFQLGPATIRLTAGLAGWPVVGSIILLLVLVGFGRIYCSTFCPLGFLQDISIWIGKIFNAKYQWEIYSKKQLKIFRISILLIIMVFMIAGSAFITGLLDPFSIFSRFIFLLKMLFLGQVIGSVLVILFIVLSSFLILLLAVKKGRFFCTWICPVGTMLWGLSRFSLFKFWINQPACNQCGRCITECKAGAISLKEMRIDQALCVGCFNCVLVCKPDAIKIAPKIIQTKTEFNLPVNDTKDSGIKAERRKFLKQFGEVMLVLGAPAGIFGGNQLKDLLTWKDQLYRVFPLGATDLRRFKAKCTGCMICAAKCPSKIIIPSFGSIDGSPVLPVLNFQKNYCLEDCVVCPQVCPTGALQEVLPENKKTIKMASLELKLADCRIVAEGLECAICAEICPLGAIEMKQVPNQKFPVPIVIQDRCNGCGKCQYRCPVKDRKDIFCFRFFDKFDLKSVSYGVVVGKL